MGGDKAEPGNTRNKEKDGDKCVGRRLDTALREEQGRKGGEGGVKG